MAPAAPTPRDRRQPILWIIAGPNGSGKSTLYNRTDIEDWGGTVWIINPDLLTARLRAAESLSEQDANVAALNRIERWLDASIDVHQTIGVETVLSTPKYRMLIERAKEKGFEIRMLYVLLDSAERQIERVRIRVARGGHDVPEDKIRARRLRSFDQLALFAKHVDRLMIFDNSTAEPKLLAAKRFKEPLRILRALPPDLLDRLEAPATPMERRSAGD